MDNKKLKILIRGVNWIGDAVITIPAIRSIRHAFPDAHISLLVKPWVSEIFRESPDIDEIILYDDTFKGWRGRFKLAKQLRDRSFDKTFLLQNAFDAALITWLSGIPERIGYSRDRRGLLLTKAVPVEKAVLKQHQVYYYLDLLKTAGIEPADAHPYLHLTDSERQSAGNLLSSYFTGDKGPLIGVNPGATFGSAKRWPPELFAQLIINLISELNGRVLITGGPSEVEITNEIITEINRLKIKLHMGDIDSRMLVMAGKTNLRQLAALISECDVFVTNDSGPMHMASALFVPVVAIFGSTDKTATGPYGDGHRIISKDLECAPCMERECPEGHLNCMTAVTAEEVFNAVREILPANKAVFLDKDGTLIEDKHYLNSFDDLVILRGTKAGLKRLKEAGFKLIGITNQSGIARGIVDREFVKESNTYLEKELGMDDFYFCPHHPDERCSCRKPEPLLLLKARSKHRIDFRSSYVIGDRESDVLLSGKTGVTSILLSPTPLFEKTVASYIARDLNDAVEWILAREMT